MTDDTETLAPPDTAAPQNAPADVASIAHAVGMLLSQQHQRTLQLLAEHKEQTAHMLDELARTIEDKHLKPLVLREIGAVEDRFRRVVAELADYVNTLHVQIIELQNDR